MSLNLQQRWPEDLRSWLSAEARRIGVNETRYLIALAQREREHVEATGQSSIAERVPTKFRPSQLKVRGIEHAYRPERKKTGPKKVEREGPPPPPKKPGRPPKPR